ncbi:hypothetical protein PMIN06_002215 [Paraphaeosphaeria minitans]
MKPLTHCSSKITCANHDQGSISAAVGWPSRATLATFTPADAAVERVPGSKTRRLLLEWALRAGFQIAMSKRGSRPGLQEFVAAIMECFHIEDVVLQARWTMEYTSTKGDWRTDR